MTTEAPYTRMEGVAQQLRLLKVRRDFHRARLHDHYEALKDKEVRGLLLKNAAHDILHTWKPAEMVKAALEPAKGLAPLLVQFLATGGSMKRKLFFTLLSMTAPALLKRFDMGKVAGVVGGWFASRSTMNGHAETVETDVIGPR